MTVPSSIMPPISTDYAVGLKIKVMIPSSTPWSCSGWSCGDASIGGLFGIASQFSVGMHEQVNAHFLLRLLILLLIILAYSSTPSACRCAAAVSQMKSIWLSIPGYPGMYHTMRFGGNAYQVRA